eukprot:gi/632943540/ref/XP_007887003.1/ PREDICTED: tRNA-splicing endonuclease subunit Sen54 [Callorhinchus milii]
MAAAAEEPSDCGESDRSRVLSCEELFAARSRDHKIPQRSHGQKDFFPDQSEEQAEKLRLCREEQRQLLSEERVERLGSLVRTEWNRQENIVELTSNAGKFWHTMGHVRHGKQLLYPEEALYLLECGSIQIYYRELPLSIQEAYEILLSAQTIPLHHYQVYSHLKRLGYVVMRFNPSGVPTAYEQKLNLEPHLKASDKHQRKRKRSISPDTGRGKDSDRGQAERSREGERSVVAEAEEGVAKKSQCLDGDGSLKDKVEPPLEPGLRNASIRLESAQEASGSVDDWPMEESTLASPGPVHSSPQRAHTSSVSMRRLRWDFSQIRFPNFARDCPHTNLPALDADLLPENVVGQACDAGAWRHKLNQKQEKMSFREREKQERASRYKTDINKDRRVRQCANWKEYKTFLKWKQNRHDELPPHLWKDQVQPLIKPRQVTSPGDLLQRIGILHSTRLLDGAACLKESTESVKITFNVYQADTVAAFRKSQPGKPYSRMCVCSFEESVPDLRLMKALSYQSGDVPIVFAVVDSGDISFYTFKEFKLPVDVYH